MGFAVTLRLCFDCLLRSCRNAAGISAVSLQKQDSPEGIQGLRASWASQPPEPEADRRDDESSGAVQPCLGALPSTACPRAEDITAISSSDSAERRPLRRRSGRGLLRGLRPLAPAVLALPVEPSRPPNEVDELVAELAEAQELQKKMSRLLSMVSQGEQVVEVEEVEAVEADDDGAVVMLEAVQPEDRSPAKVPSPEKATLTEGPADADPPPILEERGKRRVEEVEAVEHEVAQLPAEGPSDFADLQDLPEDPPQEPASDGLEFEGSESEEGPVLPTNEADGLVAELAEVQELQKKMSRLLKKVAQRGERRVEEVQAVEHEVAQLPTEGPSDFADLQDLPEDPPQEPASDGLEFEGSESEEGPVFRGSPLEVAMDGLTHEWRQKLRQGLSEALLSNLDWIEQAKSRSIFRVPARVPAAEARQAEELSLSDVEGNAGVDLEEMAVQPLRDRVQVLEEKLGLAENFTETDGLSASVQVAIASPKNMHEVISLKDEATDKKSQPNYLKVRSVDSQDVDALTEDDMRVAFNRDIWTYFALVGLGRTGSWDACFTFILALVSLAMQAAFIMILMSEFFLERPFEEKVELARIWRNSVAHDSRHMDLAQTSLTSRVCRGDGALIVSTTQAELVEEINKFLGLGLHDFEPSSFSPGTMLCVLCILLWCMRVYKDVRRMGLVMEAWSWIPRSDYTIMNDNFGFTELSENRFYGFGSILFVCFAMDCLLLVAGIRLLASTTSISSLILDAVALEAILDIDDFMFHALVPLRARLLIQSLEPMQVKISQVRSQVESGCNFCLLAFALVLPYLFMLAPLGHAMQAVKYELCGGTQEFVVAYNQDIQMTYALRTQAERGIELLPSEVAVEEFKHSTEALPRYMVFSATSQAFDTDQVRTMAEEASTFPICFETQVLQETGRVYRDPVAMSLIEPRFQSMVAKFGRNATTCEELQDLCHLPEARMLRYICGATCGCASAGTSTWYKVARQGCSESCLKESDAATPCTDVAATSEGWRSFWMNYVPVVSSFFGQNLAQANMLTMLNQTVQAMLSEGCPRLLVNDTDFVTSVRWCEGFPDLFRPVAFLCPETCGCKASLAGFCPSKCLSDAVHSSSLLEAHAAPDNSQEVPKPTGEVAHLLSELAKGGDDVNAEDYWVGDPSLEWDIDGLRDDVALVQLELKVKQERPTDPGEPDPAGLAAVRQRLLKRLELAELDAEVLAEQAVLAEPCASGEEFAIAAQQDWNTVGAFSRAKLLALRWRSAVQEGSELTALGPLRGWPGPASATSKAPGIPRLRGVAAFNGMAVLKMVVKPSILKTIEAQPRHGMAIYADGSLLNHSCLPNVN
ncbi:unnamed protein product, partial [Symbiodinium necroappetens]